MESVLSEMDLVAQYLNSSTCDRSVYPAIVALCENLKMFGPQLENVYKGEYDQLYKPLMLYWWCYTATESCRLFHQNN